MMAEDTLHPYIELVLICLTVGVNESRFSCSCVFPEYKISMMYQVHLLLTGFVSKDRGRD